MFILGWQTENEKIEWRGISSENATLPGTTRKIQKQQRNPDQKNRTKKKNVLMCTGSNYLV